MGFDLFYYTPIPSTHIGPGPHGQFINDSTGVDDTATVLFKKSSEISDCCKSAILPVDSMELQVFLWNLWSIVLYRLNRRKHVDWVNLDNFR
jgi:hypothetical protein